MTAAVPELVVKKRRLPLVTDSVSVVVAASAALPLSGSAILMPVMNSSVFSGIAAMLAGRVTVGVSLTLTTPTVEVIATVVVSTPLFSTPPLSWICVSVKTRLPALGASTFVFW